MNEHNRTRLKLRSACTCNLRHGEFMAGGRESILCDREAEHHSFASLAVHIGSSRMDGIQRTIISISVSQQSESDPEERSLDVSGAGSR